MKFNRYSLAAVLVGVLLLIYSLNFLPNMLQGVLNPVGAATNRLSQNLKFKTGYLTDYEIDEKQSLQSELNQLRSQLAELERIKQQNQQLRQELGFLGSSELELAPADVVNYNPDISRDMLRINLGSRHGIEAGMPVIAQSGLVGVVESVNHNTSKVVLVTDISFRALVLIGEEAEGVVKGQIAGGVVVEQLPRDLEVNPGDIIYTSGRDGVFPPGLLVGSVRSLTQSPNEVFDTAQITPAVRYMNLQVVNVVKSQ